MKVTILGSGTSGGVPLIGCDCKVCHSDNPKNKRRRVSVLVETAGKKILIDTSPDLRMQALDNKFSTVDAILYTHAHADHAHGIDETRSFNVNSRKPLDCYGDAECLGELARKFDYAFKPPVPKLGWFRPALVGHIVEPGKGFEAAGVPVMPFLQDHGVAGLTLGYRIGNFAYSTDLNSLPPESMEKLKNLDTWVVDCLQYKPHPTHAHVELVLKWVKELQPRQAILTHMSHNIEYETIKASLPHGIEPGYDGMVLEVR
jgi:phosphoribosyl 1,2-cyclic phosphate phosphodiesterase